VLLVEADTAHLAEQVEEAGLLQVGQARIERLRLPVDAFDARARQHALQLRGNLLVGRKGCRSYALGMQRAVEMNRRRVVIGPGERKLRHRPMAHREDLDDIRLRLGQPLETHGGLPGHVGRGGDRGVGPRGHDRDVHLVVERLAQGIANPNHNRSHAAAELLRKDTSRFVNCDLGIVMCDS
jgi:hypothetical protein